MSDSVKSLPITQDYETVDMPKKSYSVADTNIADSLRPLKQPGVNAPKAHTTGELNTLTSLDPLIPEKKGFDIKNFDIKEVVKKAKGEFSKAKDWMGENKGVTIMGAAGLGFATLVGLMALVKVGAAKGKKGRGGRGKREGRLTRRAFEEYDRGVEEDVIDAAFEDPEFLEFMEELAAEMDFE